MNDDLSTLTRAELEAQLLFWRTQSLLLAEDFGRLRQMLTDRTGELAEMRAQLVAYAEDLNREYQLERQRTQEVESLLVATVGALANAIEARDPYTRGHTDRVARVALGMCARLGWTEKQLQTARMGALLHDIGKIGVPDAVLRKPGPLDAEEVALMRRHPEIGAGILQGIEALAPAVPFVIAHHERWDGKGYPRGLKGEEIPLEGRILAIADAFDAMTSLRSYRTPVSLEDAAAEIQACAGTQFDPNLVPVFISLFEDGIIQQLLELNPRWGLYAV
ncbi:MAG: HD-GYP domain-containing protein [Bacillota bacterium]